MALLVGLQNVDDVGSLIVTTSTGPANIGGIQYQSAVGLAEKVVVPQASPIPAALTVNDVLEALKDALFGQAIVAPPDTLDSLRKQLKKRNWIHTSKLRDKDSSGLTGFIEDCVADNFEFVGISLFEPKLRIYIDTGSDDPKRIENGIVTAKGEVDLFQDGALLPALELIELQFRNQIGNDQSPWFWGPNLGVGITSGGHLTVETKDAAGVTTTTTESLNSAALLFDLGLSLDYLLKPNLLAESSSVSIEAGYTIGITANEGLDDIDDGAVFVGIVYSVAF